MRGIGHCWRLQARGCIAERGGSKLSTTSFRAFLRSFSTVEESIGWVVEIVWKSREKFGIRIARRVERECRSRVASN